MVRNGYLPEREVLIGIGPVAVKVPRVRDRTGGELRFESKLVPAYVRRAASVDAALPWLYLRGISQADVGPALQALVGQDAANLSAPVISRLKRSWQDEHTRVGRKAICPKSAGSTSGSTESIRASGAITSDCARWRSSV